MHHRLLAFVAFASLLSAQQTKVFPRGMDFVEGPTVFTSPFGTTGFGIQLLIDGSEVTSGIALISGMRFRPTQQTQTTASFTKSYQVDAYTVAMNAATFAAMASPYTPSTVLGGAAPTTVFNGPITLPATAPLSVTSAPFSIYIPFTPPYLFDPSQGNLVLMIDATDLIAPPATCRVDAVQFRNTATTTPAGIVAPIDTQGCIVNGNSMTSATLDTLAILGGAIQTQLTANPPGSLPAAFTVLAFDRADTDLALIGMPGCIARISGPFFDSISIAGVSGFAPIVWPVPNTANLLGAAAITQSVGLAPSGLLADSVISNAEAIRIGDSALPVPTVMCGFHTVSGAQNAWFHGIVGGFSPVVQLEGILP